jgi:hypothetical protein
VRNGVGSEIRRGTVGLLAGLSRTTGDGRQAFLPDALAALRTMPAQAVAPEKLNKKSRAMSMYANELFHLFSAQFALIIWGLPA